jgi:LmbE family N-acetylglucosaminyl deacetylase
MRKHVMAWAAAAVLMAGPAFAQLAPIPEDRGGNGLGLALRRVGTTARVLYVTAHPDDENNGMLVRLSRGLGARTALLTLTRGDGGQNAIGPELFDALAVLRAEELNALHRYDGAEQYFGLSSDFGYSFSVEETFARWGHDQALGDVVRVVRSFRPDVILTLPLQTVAGGLHHQAAGRLAKEAFAVAADPARYADLGPSPWQARKVYETGVGGGPLGDKTGVVTVRTGVYDPLLGLTWQQFGSVARAMHRSQTAGQLMASPVEGEASFILLDSAPAVTGPEGDVLDGVDPTLLGLLRFAPDHETAAPFLRPDLMALQARVDAARAAFDPAAPEKTLPSLEAVLVGTRALEDKVRSSGLAAAAKAEVVNRLDDEVRDTQDALRLAHGLDVEALASDDVVVPGQTFTVATRVANLGAAPIELEDVAVRAAEGWTVRALEGAPRALARGESVTFRHEVTVPAGAPPSQPYWRRVKGADRFELVDASAAGKPWGRPAVIATASYRSGQAAAAVTVPAEWRYEWPAGGEKQKVAVVGSEFSVRLQPEVTVAALGARAPREFRVSVRNQRKGPAAGAVRLEAPAGWSVDPREAPLRFRYEGEEVAARFTATPGAVAAGESRVRAVFTDDGGKAFDAYDQVVAYSHVLERRLVRPAAARVVALDVAVAPGTSIGYVDGAGDETDAAIQQLGIPLTYLAPDDLAFGDLSRFTTIVTGVRAYQVRPDLRSFNHRLMDFVQAGGNLVVQYNRPEFNVASESGTATSKGDSPYAPYPAATTNDRVSDETAAPKILHPESALFAGPNRIGPADWEGWVQERGLNLLEARDPRYEDLVAFTDPFPLNPGEKRGALVDAAVGKGRWTYVGLGLFRELPAGVPGAYRLLANLVGRPRGR